MQIGEDVQQETAGGDCDKVTLEVALGKEADVFTCHLVLR